LHMQRFETEGYVLIGEHGFFHAEKEEMKIDRQVNER
jgi:hypothetical protein